jgi:hypothetical protein
LLLVDSISPDDEGAQALLHDIEFLRDPSHVRNRQLAEWLVMLARAGFLVATTRPWAVELDIPDWTQRMRTPPAAVLEIEQRLRSASAEVRACLQIAEREGVLCFTLPVALILARKMV